ncbi:CCR4-NOT transcription complex subunit 2-like isoform X3 [Gigantopelta aegis]|uniref:CCR4-NOT transcription complex subunit 2-like isoform X3 n=1 Tax=Gigantopelta aegis TaxID=1735272 RepID=UPI001B888AD7|nr:CCR4-NOT transcription complex subunit 2-like isoform X3 [Gigantopelta aegis]
MAFRSSQLDSMTGAGAGTTNNSSQRFGSDHFWNVQFNLNTRKNIPDPSSGARKNIGMVGLPQQNKQRKMGFFDVSGDDDSETSQYLNQSVFRPEKEMSHSQSPSQLFGSNFCSPAIPILPRNVSGSQFPPRNNPGHITPTSINPNFPISMQQQQQQQQQQHSPNSLSAIGPRSVLGQNQTQQQAIGNLQKRTTLSSAFGSAGPITSIANSFGFPGSRQGENHLSLDLNEFPSLSNRSNLAPNPVPTPRSYVGLVSKPVQEQTPEFNITAEEFPALPGSTNPPSSAANDSGRKTVSALFGPPNPYMPAPGGGAFDPSANKDTKNGDKSSQPKRGIQTHQDGTVSNIPSGMVTDQFGIVGLLTFIRAAENDHNLVALAPGIDLTTLGLNLNSPEYVRNLYSTFQSPWADAPCRPQDIDFHVPAEYLTNIFIRDKLAPIKLNRYGEDLLFFLFYMNGGDVLQLAAAAELYNRDWRYHKEERVWMTRAPGMEPLMKTNTYERGTYYFFDAQNWRKVAKEFLLEYDKLEERPTLPPTLHHNPNQPIVGH